MVTLHHGDPIMVDHTPSSAVLAGDVVVIGQECRICHTDIPANRTGALAAPGGNAVCRSPKATGAAINDGAPAYWNAGNKNVQAGDASGTLPRLGFAVGTAGSGATEAFIRHDSAPPTE